MRTALAAAVLDVALILLFVVLGRDTHQHGLDAVGVLSVAWPFLAGAALGWLLTRAWRSPWRLWPAGVVIWLITAAGGLALRGAIGGGLAPAFVLVTFGFLALVLLGHRLAATLLIRTRRR